MKLFSRRNDLRLVLALAAGALAVSCGDTRQCKDGTLFVTVIFAGDALSADKLVVDVSPEGDPARQSTFDHAPGSANGSIEIEFPQGYQSGRYVQVVLTAQTAGTPVGSVTGSVVLGAGCSTLNIRLDGGNNSDGGGDAPVDRAGGQGGSGGITGGSGGAPGTGGGAGAGAGSGGAAGAGIDSGVDLGCVFQSAEDCFNGIDDDCNGHTDCDDPACTPSTVCVPAAGSNGFTAGTWIDPAQTCPSRFDAGESGINATLDPGAGCTGCSCKATVSCSTNLYKFGSQLSCTTNLSPMLAGGITASYTTGAASATTSCLASLFTTTTNASIGPYVATSGACVPQGTPTRSTPSWATSRKFCSAATIGKGCSPGYVCVPKAAPNHCVMALGAKACPAGYTKDGGSWYTGFSDTRACSACTCGTQTPGSCSAMQVSFYFGTSTTCTAGTHRAGGASSTVCTFGGDCGSAGFTGTPTAPTCPGVSTVMGAVTATGEQTLCCF